MNFEMLTIVIIVLCALNLGAFILVGVDKSKSLGESERVPEIYFFVWAVCGASLGVLLGMFVFHHKTRKLKFVFGIGLLVIQQGLLLNYFLQ
jgi:uncharacterized membrane protein YsdA (DUF1294 family)